MVQCHQRLLFHVMLSALLLLCAFCSYAYLVILTRYLSLAVTSMLFTSSRPLPLTVTRSPACGHHPQHIHHTEQPYTKARPLGPSQMRAYLQIFSLCFCLP